MKVRISRPQRRGTAERDAELLLYGSNEQIDTMTESRARDAVLHESLRVWRAVLAYNPQSQRSIASGDASMGRMARLAANALLFEGRLTRRLGAARVE